MKLISTLFDIAFLLATSYACSETSIAETFACGKFAFNEIGIQPVPVPISKIFKLEAGSWKLEVRR